MPNESQPLSPNWRMNALVARFVGVVTIALLQRHVYASAADPLVPNAAARRLALVSLVVWTAAITAGRLLAYI